MPSESVRWRVWSSSASPAAGASCSPSGLSVECIFANMIEFQYVVTTASHFIGFVSLSPLISIIAKCWAPLRRSHSRPGCALTASARSIWQLSAAAPISLAQAPSPSLGRSKSRSSAGIISEELLPVSNSMLRYLIKAAWPELCTLTLVRAASGTTACQ